MNPMHEVLAVLATVAGAAFPAFERPVSPLDAAAGEFQGTAPAGAAQAQPAATPAEPTPERLREAWSFLTEAEQVDAEAYLREATRHMDTFQQSLIAFARGLDPRDPGLLPEAPPTPFYSPDTHAPRQPIDRRRLEPQDPRALRQQKTMFTSVPKTGHELGWRYDWASREVQRIGAPSEPTRVFFNALAGFPPQADLAQALIEQALDDGGQQKTLAAFAHAYTDRSGSVYPGLSLYDAWSSGAEMEMPDVDVLGIIHDLANDWTTWIAPVPDSQHDELYGKVFAYFQDAKRHRGLRTALAMTYVNGSIPLRDGYGGHRDRFHSWWDEQASTPAGIAELLPKPADWAKFLEEWSARIDQDADLTQRGQVRRATLDADAARVRATALAILVEFKALERKARPSPPPPAPPPAPPQKQ